MRPRLTDFYRDDEKELAFFVDTLRMVFDDARWVYEFLKRENDHHGLVHAEEVRLRGLKLIPGMEDHEKKDLLAEGRLIYKKNPIVGAVVAVEFGARFHDCGRFDDAGNSCGDNQLAHPFIGAERVKYFCEELGLTSLVDFVYGAVLSHDYQNPKLTPAFTPPTSMIGRIVQSADQLGWFHPDSLERTIGYGKDEGRPFFDKNLDLYDRMKWLPQTRGPDDMTVLLTQIYGYSGDSRFSISSARKKIAEYRDQLKSRVLDMAHMKGVLPQVEELMTKYERVRPYR
jgi:hypothetical protein